MTRSRAVITCVVVVATSALFSAACTTLPLRVAWPAKASRSATATPTPGSAMARRLSAVAPPEHGAYLGVFSPLAPFKPSAIDDFTRVSGRAPAIVMWYQPWGQGGSNRFDSAACAAVLERGAVPMITWEPWAPGNQPHFLKHPADQPAYSLKAIASGKYDDYIRTWARGIKTLGGPVMLRPMHEMNGNWYPWGGQVNGNSPQQFILAWRHIHDVFEEEGVKNVTWVWSINRVSAPATPDNSCTAYYPGDQYVDWTGLSGFNWGTTTRSGWMDFESINGDALRQLRQFGKPIVIGETGSVESGGDKAAWLTDAYATVARSYPEVRAIVYYDADEPRPDGSRDWRIDSSPASLAAFRKAIASADFASAPVLSVSMWSSGLSDAEHARLQALTPIY